ncbi:MAG: oxidoreductase [Candidatus Heimdallarchaeota archaeon]|nr:oxidoreductase [Candidatus Heimdallarchaeota archaeon]MCK4878659.1 oxidoreductase [Candidatus Heimdallarchaeota archaeon]
MSDKLKIAFYWAASCGGCEVTVLDIDEKILDVVAIADIVFWPVAIDIKYDDVRAMEDKSIDVTFFNGSIRTEENAELARLLRAKSKTLIAFGSCSCFGGVIGLGNLSTKEELLHRAYITSDSTENPEQIKPQLQYKEVHIPDVLPANYALDQVVDVEYYLPGCPPKDTLVWNAVEAIASGKLPPKGSVLAPNLTVCHDCPREKHDERKIKEFKRIYEFQPNETDCLLEQGLICMGPATRSGCDAACISVNMPCRGCMGPTDQVFDQGAKMISVLGGLIDSDDHEEIKEIVSTIVDPVGTLYYFGVSKSLIKQSGVKKEVKQ